LKILILKPSSLGDVVQALPVLRLLKQHWPDSHIFWWVEKRFHALLENDPDLAGIFLFDREGWGRPWRWPEAIRSIRAMRQQRFELVIDLQGLFRSASVAWLASGEMTIGLDDPREGAAAFYDLAVARPSPTTHAVGWYLEVLRYLNVPVHSHFTWLPAQPRIAKAIRTKWPIEDRQWIVLQPGARWESKRWPIEHFSAALQRLARTLPRFHFAVMGGTDDMRIAAELVQCCPDRCLDLTGQTSLPEMVEWIRASKLMLTNDTGPMHVAAALGQPVVAIFGPTDARRTGPFGQLEGVLRASPPCAPCLQEHCCWPRHLECLWSVTPDAVCERVEAILGVE
jgi:heptosyltransferase-1